MVDGSVAHFPVLFEIDILKMKIQWSLFRCSRIGPRNMVLYHRYPYPCACDLRREQKEVANKTETSQYIHLIAAELAFPSTGTFELVYMCPAANAVARRRSTNYHVKSSPLNSLNTRIAKMKSLIVTAGLALMAAWAVSCVEMIDERYPRLIVHLDSDNPDEASGTQYGGKLHWGWDGKNPDVRGSWRVRTSISAFPTAPV
ncbi:hypothetical protein P152DRAFT_183028 [Eremomyces bilateralis CBS 781.70]|uniref:Uncharacterized protein n=1 Tax=Eremomyces bilateralis CBS 781.70 TaxID=1392243 RepID=A0A6G1GBG8_9PEZI|nr:uncharacterized protein P152DRAFT_183028 [Eremomyces bilateralis CBS 781.70]KAF1815354.1 hypothetical protein P152DRAFT_183028 [Eremomyces bilateralis CBS 781.70]